MKPRIRIRFQDLFSLLIINKHINGNAPKTGSLNVNDHLWYLMLRNRYLYSGYRSIICCKWLQSAMVNNDISKPGGRLIIKMPSYQYRNFLIKIRSHARLIFIMEIPYLYILMWPYWRTYASISLVIIGWGGGLTPCRREVLAWTNAGSS